MTDDKLAPPESLVNPAQRKGRLQFKLGASVLLRLSLLLAGVSLTLFLVLDQLLSSRLDAIDARQYQNDLTRFAELVDAETRNMHSSLLDYAQWDDTYAFADNSDPAYLESNFHDAGTLSNLKMDGLIMIAKNGHPLASLEIDAEGDQHTYTAPEQSELVRQLSELGMIYGASQADELSLIWLQGRPLLVASSPIVNSRNNLEARGRLLMFRYLDGAYLEYVRQLTGNAVELRPLADGEHPQAQSSLSAGLFHVSRPLLERAQWQLQGPTRLASERQLTRWSLVISMAGLLLFTLFGLYWILRRHILQRLQHFATQAEALQHSGDLSIRWPDAGRDELDSLGLALNRLISRVDTQQLALHKLAHQDVLTQLSNRRELMLEITRAVALCQRNQSRAALLLLDLDNFKTLNDSLGHTAGDQFLQHIATRLRETVRTTDCVARLGGDEFVVLLENLSSSAEAAALQVENVATKLLEAISQPCEVAGTSFCGTASLGVALFGGSPTSPEELLQQADIAMYRVKQSGRHSWRFFESAMQDMVLGRIAEERELRTALQEQQFSLHYQIQVGASGQALGAEALLRWQHPLRGMVSPGQFIPLAEETGLILPIGHWVLECACKQLAAWNDAPLLGQLSLAVNLSAQQFHQPGIVKEIQEILQRTGADPRRLKLELTESLLVVDMAQVISKMSALKALGIRFALDDFGTGYSSLAYLKRLPLDQLKIDQSFVRDILDDPNDAAIASMVISLAQLMNLEVIAEGVETEAQRAFLQERGCLAFQGYLFSRPLPLEAFEQQVRFMGSNTAQVTNSLISRQ